MTEASPTRRLPDLDPGQLALELVNAPLEQEILSPTALAARTETAL